MINLFATQAQYCKIMLLSTLLFTCINKYLFCCYLYTRLHLILYKRKKKLVQYLEETLVFSNPIPVLFNNFIRYLLELYIYKKKTVYINIIEECASTKMNNCFT